MASDPRELAGALLWVGISGPELDLATSEHLAMLRPSGVILFRRNIQSVEQTAALCAGLRALLHEDLFIAVDQEGGLVERFAGLLPSFPGNMALGAIALREPTLGEHLALQQGRLIGHLLRECGVDVVLAPALDLAVSGANPSTGIRSFGGWPAGSRRSQKAGRQHDAGAAELAVRLGAKMIAGFSAGGVLSCAKHFPGLGAAVVDSHLDLPVVPADDRTAALAPFRAAIGAGVPLMMSSHVVYEALDAERPATFSAATCTALLRGELGFEGLLLSDDLEMGAMSKRFGFEQVVRGVLSAGHDVLTLCNRPELQLQAHALLTEGIAREAAWCASAKASAVRLQNAQELSRKLRATCISAQSKGEAITLASAIAGRSITVVQDPQKLVPLKAGEQALLILPVLEAGTPVEDPLRGEADGSALIDALGSAVRVLRLPARPTAPARAAALQEAGKSRTVLLALTAARGIPEQAALLQELCTAHPRVILLALRSPFDLEAAPSQSVATMLASYGFRDAQLAALASVLLGRTQPFGWLPVELQPNPS